MSMKKFAAALLMAQCCWPLAAHAQAGAPAAAPAQARPAAPRATPPAARAAAPRAAPAAATPIAAPPPVRGEAIASIVNDQVISTFDVNQRTLLMLLSSGIDKPNEEVIRQVRESSLRALQDERLQMAEAKRLEIKIEPAEVDSALDTFARSNRVTVETLKAQLAANNIGINTLRQRFEASLAWNKIVGRTFSGRVRISPAQVNETLARYAEYASKEQYDLLAILIPVDKPENLPAATRGAQSLIDAIRQGANFQQVARQFSGLPSSAAGGELGWLSKNEISPPELQNVVDTMQPGSLGGPFQTTAGLYILALRDKREGIDPKTTRKVTLQQISAPLDRRDVLDRARRRVNGCATIAAATSGQSSLEVTVLGEVMEAELSDDLSGPVAETPVGAASNIFESGGKLRSLVVCARDNAGGAIPTRQQVENQLQDQEYDLLAERYMRRLRREATIISR
jgi:peptidyl-prolyl cis-trans isomerase SurA